MKFVIGKTTDEFTVLGEDGEDITRHFHVREIKVHLVPNEVTMVYLSLYAELEIEPGALAADLVDPLV